MKSYKNVAGNSGVEAFEKGPDFIRVKFVDGPVYLYTYESTGKKHVEKMKSLADSGEGLSSYISTEVRESYSSKSQ